MKSVLEYKGYKARIDFDADDHILVGRIAGINDVVGFHGNSVEEVEAAFHEAVDDYVETCVKLGKAPERSFSGNVMVRIDPGLHAGLTQAAELSGKSLNQWIEEVLAGAVFGQDTRKQERTRRA
jgi:predicted HicB family RNase H-like nuclease